MPVRALLPVARRWSATGPRSCLHMFSEALAITACVHKEPRPAFFPQVERHWASFWHEAELMSRLNHPNVLRFFGLVVEGPMVVGIMTGGHRGACISCGVGGVATLALLLWVTGGGGPHGGGHHDGWV